MKKTIIVILIILILSVIFILFNMINLVSGRFKSDNNYAHSWTKAICNETYCQDYEIVCKGNKLVSISPISGAVISISDNWIDPRSEEEKKRICD